MEYGSPEDQQDLGSPDPQHLVLEWCPPLHLPPFPPVQPPLRPHQVSSEWFWSTFV